MVYAGLLVILTLANIGGVEWFIVGSEKPGLAFVAINALRVMATVLANTSAFVQAVNVQRFAQVIDFRVVFALVRVTKTVAS